ncbi:hypothetical protein Y047_6061 [Burkholderia pseudomallei MSHR3016]|nr:hypothetical protein Y047_6061 [Burkholderia pseudomallei MSHR3016]
MPAGGPLAAQSVAKSANAMNAAAATVAPCIMIFLVTRLLPCAAGPRALPPDASRCRVRRVGLPSRPEMAFRTRDYLGFT